MYVLIEVKLIRTCILLHLLHFKSFFFLNKLFKLTLEDLENLENLEQMELEVMVVVLVFDDNHDDDDHDIMVYDDDHDVYDVHEYHVQIHRVVNKRLVVVHELKHQLHQTMVHQTMCIMVNVDVDSKRLELVVEMVPNHLDLIDVLNVLCLPYQLLLVILYHSFSNDY